MPNTTKNPAPTKKLKSSTEAALDTLPASTIWESAMPTKITKEELLAVHAKNSKPGFNWMQLKEVKTRYSVSAATLHNLCSLYHIPTITLDASRPTLISLPCLEYVLITAEDLHDTHVDDTAHDRIEKMREQAFTEIKAKMVSQFESKLNS